MGFPPLKPPPRGKRRPAWLRHRTVWWAALVLWLLAIAVRLIRDLTGAAGTASYGGFLLGVTVFLGMAVFGGYLAGTFLGLLSGIWSARIEGFRKLRSGMARPFGKVREEGAGAVVVGLIVEGFLYWFALLSLFGVVVGLIVVGLVAWQGDAASFSLKGR